MDLSKVFDTINCELLVVKFNVHGFCKEALFKIIEIKNNIYIIENFTSWKELLCGLPHRSVLGPIPFNRYLNDFFAFKRNRCLQFCR